METESRLDWCYALFPHPSLPLMLIGNVPPLLLLFVCPASFSMGPSGVPSPFPPNGPPPSQGAGQGGAGQAPPLDFSALLNQMGPMGLGSAPPTGVRLGGGEGGERCSWM